MSAPSKHDLSLAETLGPDGVELVRLMESDLARHEAAINEHHRTCTTIRGFALTVLAALVVAGITSHSVVPGLAAFCLAPILAFADYYYSRLYLSTQQRLRVLVPLSTKYRQLCGRRFRRPAEIQRFRGDLRALSPGAVIPSDRPSLLPVRPLGRFGLFLPAYLAMMIAAGVSAVVVLETSTSRASVYVCIRVQSVGPRNHLLRRNVRPARCLGPGASSH
jgi:hypothetical protein